MENNKEDRLTCPDSAPGCGGPENPWPCNACGVAYLARKQDEWDAYRRAEAGQANVEASRAEVRALLPGVFG